MVHHGKVEHFCVFGGSAHEFVILHALAVVGDGDDAGTFERADRRESLALHTDSDTAGWVNFDHSVAANGVVNVLDRAGCIRDR